MELTLENKAKFFFANYGSTYRYSNEWGSFRNEVSENNLHLARDIENGAYLELKHLGMMSNEEVGKISNYINFKEDLAIFRRENEDVAKAEIRHKVENCLNVNCIDYLRSKGYAIPWMGISVKSLASCGWIRIKQ